jgi:hypothetical protein
MVILGVVERHATVCVPTEARRRQPDVGWSGGQQRWLAARRGCALLGAPPKSVAMCPGLGWVDLDHEWAEADNVAGVRAGVPGVPQRSAQVALGAGTAEIEAEAAE